MNWSVYFDETQNFMHMVIAMPKATIPYLHQAVCRRRPRQKKQCTFPAVFYFVRVVARRLLEAYPQTYVSLILSKSPVFTHPTPSLKIVSHVMLEFWLFW